MSIPHYSKCHPQDTIIDIVVDGEGRVLVVISARDVVVDCSSGGRAPLSAWRLLIIAFGVVHCRGLVNGVVCPTPPPPPAPCSNFGSRWFLLVVCIAFVWSISSGNCLRRHRKVAGNALYIVTAITNK